MINGYYFHKMRNSAKGTFATEIITLVTPFAAALPALEGHLNRVAALYETYNSSLSRLNVVDLSGQIADADAELDAEIVNLRDYADVCSRRSIAAQASAAAVILNTYRTIGWDMHRESYVDELQKVGNLVDLLHTDAKHQAAVATIKAESWVEAIVANRNKVLDLINARTDRASVQEAKANTAQTGKELGKAIDSLFRFIQSEVEFYNRTELLPLVDKINVVNARYAAQVAQHATRKQDTEAAGS